MSYSWQSLRAGVLRDIQVPWLHEPFLTQCQHTPFSMSSAGSLILMHMLMRLQEMSQFAACFVSEPACLLAHVGKAACSHSEAMAQGSLLLQDQGQEGVFRAQISPWPFAQSPDLEGSSVGTEFGGCVLEWLSEPPDLHPPSALG